MINFQKIKNINKLEKYWRTLQNENQNIDAMADFDFVKTFISGLSNKVKKIIQRKTLVFFVVFEDDLPILIFSAEEKREEISSLYTLDFYDIVTPKNIDSKIIKEAFILISKKEGKKIVLKNIKENNNAYNILKDAFDLKPSGECVKIAFNEDYDEYYRILSKHARQNLRTAYNRLKSDNLNYSLDFYCGKIDKKLANQLKRLYLNRRVKKYKNMNFFKKLIYTIDEPISKVCFSLKNSFSAVLRVNGKIACFMSGVVKNGEVIVPRLAIDDEFSRYSVGVILVNETIKKLIKMKLFTLDLAMGTEAYKLQMGGVVYSVYMCEVNGD